MVSAQGFFSPASAVIVRGGQLSWSLASSALSSSFWNVNFWLCLPKMSFGSVYRRFWLDVWFQVVVPAEVDIIHNSADDGFDCGRYSHRLRTSSCALIRHLLLSLVCFPLRLVCGLTSSDCRNPPFQSKLSGLNNQDWFFCWAFRSWGNVFLSICSNDSLSCPPLIIVLVVQYNWIGFVPGRLLMLLDGDWIMRAEVLKWPTLRLSLCATPVGY